MRALLLALLLLLPACGRPLSDGETRFARDTLGPTLDTSRVRVHRSALVGLVPLSRPARPAVACRERIRPPERGIVTGRIAAMVLFNRIVMANPLYLDDFLSDYPRSMQLEDAMLLAHELTHAWQWQNRKTTGYHPLRAATEHLPATDPYLFELENNARFEEYPFEQQASLVEEFVCCRALDPHGARTDRLHALLSPHFPQVARFPATQPKDVLLFWPNAPRSGICD